MGTSYMGRFQSGPTWTFAQRRNGALTRPDFALLPMQWGSGKIATWTAPDIIFANMVPDHIATVASIRVHTSCSTSGSE